jgi:acyl carrier protein
LTRAAILEVIQRNLAEILEKSPSDIAESATFEALGADSLALIELVEALEEELSERSSGFHIDDEDLEDLVSVHDAVDYVAAKLQVA